MTEFFMGAKVKNIADLFPDSSYILDTLGI